MIPKTILKELVVQRLKDAEALFIKKRYHSTIYMGGYAVEIALKYKICKMYLFSKGFPENKTEFQYYIEATNLLKIDLRDTIHNLKEIRNHDLSKLLYYSGVEFKIKTLCLDDWENIESWSPEMRYQKSSIKKAMAKGKLDSVKLLIQEIF